MMNRTTATAASALAFAALVLVGCGQQASVPGAPGQTAESSLEPIDAVPLPLDDNPLTPPPVIQQPRAEAKSDHKPEAETAEASAPTTAPDPETTGTTTAEPAPRPRVAPAPTLAPREASPPPPEKSEPEKPVLNF